MRIDKYLKVARVLKRRATAKSLAEHERLRINGRVAKASSEVQAGDVVVILFGQRQLTIRVLQIAEHIRKEEATTLFEVLAMQRIEGGDDDESSAEECA